MKSSLLTVSFPFQANTQPKMGENFIQGSGDLVRLIALLSKNHLKVTKPNLRWVVRCVPNKENPFVRHSSLVGGGQKPVCIYFFLDDSSDLTHLHERLTSMTHQPDLLFTKVIPNTFASFLQRGIDSEVDYQTSLKSPLYLCHWWRNIFE